MQTIYLESRIAEHPRTAEILSRFPTSRQIKIDRYNEVFNPKNQNFRLQKTNPALILAAKQQGHVLQAPLEYNIGGRNNYYFSHMINCVYDCRYCFLQGMFSSANYIIFVNYEDFFSAIDQTAARHTEPAWFFSGYDCDSLAYEPVTGFAAACLAHFSQRPDQWLELRTKSTQIRSLLQTEPVPNCVVAFSLSPDATARRLEHGAPGLNKRIDALEKLQQAGWKIGLRLDPLIYTADFASGYREFLQDLFSRIDASRLHSVSLGTFRMPAGFFRQVIRLYPDESLFTDNIEDRPDKQTGYPIDMERSLMEQATDLLLEHIDQKQLFPCV